jgi:hypothetical protein
VLAEVVDCIVGQGYVWHDEFRRAAALAGSLGAGVRESELPTVRAETDRRLLADDTYVFNSATAGRRPGRKR